MTIGPTQASSSGIQVKDLSMVYGNDEKAVPVLQGADLKVQPGELICLLGPSGSGKSTLLHLIGGLLTPTRGEIRIGDIDITTFSDDEKTDFRRRNIGFVFQFFNLVSELTLRQNVALPLLMEGVKLRHTLERVDFWLERLHLTDRRHHALAELSGGQIQRVAIARALVANPQVILADEPTGNLDAAHARAIFELFRELCDEAGITTLIATHDTTASRIANRTLIVDNSKLCEVR